MFFVARKAAVSLALAACVAYPTVHACGQDTAQRIIRFGRDSGPRDTERRDHVRFLHGSAILGSQVFLQQGVVAGTIRDFVISDNGYIEYAVVETENGFIAIPWNAGVFDVARRGFVVDFSRDRLRELRHFRHISELNDAGLQEHIQSFFRGTRTGDALQGGMNNRQPNHQQNGANTNRGVAPIAAATTNPGARTNGKRGTAPGAAPRNTARPGQVGFDILTNRPN
jgi:PRC-barrel domain